MGQSDQSGSWISEQVGARAEIGCRATLKPPVSYSWSRVHNKGIPVGASIKGSTLILPELAAKDAGIYICQANNSQTTEEIPSVLSVTNLIPFFDQNPLSYLELDHALSDAYLSFEIVLSIKPQDPNGLILYKGQTEYLSGDYITLGLRNGIPEFKFDLGSGTALIQGYKPLELGQWHTIQIERNRRNGTMTINNIEVHGMIDGKFMGLDLATPLYIGGHPDTKELGYSHGFKGCLSMLKINAMPIEISPVKVKVIGTKSCQTCEEKGLCDNRGICQEANVHGGHTCICQPGFSGPKCEKVGVACHEGACGQGRCLDTPNGFKCQCPYGLQGQFCEVAISITQPYFDEEAYLSIPEPRHILRA